MNVKQVDRKKRRHLRKTLKEKGKKMKHGIKILTTIHATHQKIFKNVTLTFRSKSLTFKLI